MMTDEARPVVDPGRRASHTGQVSPTEQTDRRKRLLHWIWPPLLLYLLAIALRLPALTTIPAITDETDELLWSLAIFRGEHWPLTSSDAYIGPLANYVTAASYTLFGPSLASGRAAAIALGALIAPATWALTGAAACAQSRLAADGAPMGEEAKGESPGHPAGILAGVLAAVAFGPVVLSHVAWSHGGAPAWLALALAGLVAASAARTPRRRAAAALAGGVCGGLAVGAHPTVVAFAPGVAVGWWLWLRDAKPERDVHAHPAAPSVQSDETRRSAGARPSLHVLAWTILGLALGYSPGLVVLARQGLAPFRASAADQDYVGVQLDDLGIGIVAWLDGVLRNLIGPPAIAVDDPRLWLGALAVAGAIVWAGWRGQRFLAVTMLSGVLFMPLVVDADKFLSLTGLRYSAPGLPILAAAVALASVDALAAELPWLAGRRPRPHRASTGGEYEEAGPGSRLGLLVAGAMLLGLLAVAIYAPMATYLFYAETERTGVTGAPVLEVAGGLARGADRRDALLVDSSFDIKLTGGGTVGRAIGALLTLEGVEYQRAKIDKIRWFLANGQGARYDLVLSGATADTLAAEFALEPVLVVPVAPEQVSRAGDHWGWYRYASR